MHVLVHGAGIQDRDGGVLVMATMSGLYPFLRKLSMPMAAAAGRFSRRA